MQFGRTDGSAGPEPKHDICPTGEEHSDSFGVASGPAGRVHFYLDWMSPSSLGLGVALMVGVMSMGASATSIPALHFRPSTGQPLDAITQLLMRRAQTRVRESFGISSHIDMITNELPCEAGLGVRNQAILQTIYATFVSNGWQVHDKLRAPLETETVDWQTIATLAEVDTGNAIGAMGTRSGGLILSGGNRSCFVSQIMRNGTPAELSTNLRFNRWPETWPLHIILPHAAHSLPSSAQSSLRFSVPDSIGSVANRNAIRLYEAARLRDAGAFRSAAAAIGAVGSKHEELKYMGAAADAYWELRFLRSSAIVPSGRGPALAVIGNESTSTLQRAVAGDARVFGPLTTTNAPLTWSNHPATPSRITHRRRHPASAVGSPIKPSTTPDNRHPNPITTGYDDLSGVRFLPREDLLCVTVTTYPRVHAGIAAAGISAWSGGDAGFQVQDLTLATRVTARTLSSDRSPRHISISFAGSNRPEGRDYDDVLQLLTRLEEFRARCQALTSDPLPQAHIEVEQSLRMHRGLGSKSSLLLAIATSYLRAIGLDVPRDVMTGLVRRGGLSGVNVATFFEGGIAIGIGQPRSDDPFAFGPSSTSFRDHPSRIVGDGRSQSALFHDLWITLVSATDSGINGISGPQEVEMFERSTPKPTRAVSRTVVNGLTGVGGHLLEGTRGLPSLRDALLRMHADATLKRDELQAQTPATKTLFWQLSTSPALRANGDHAVLLSSQGPTIAIIGPRTTGRNGAPCGFAADVISHQWTSEATIVGEGPIRHTGHDITVKPLTYEIERS